MKRDRDGPDEGDQGGQGRQTRLDSETMKYFEEVGAHFKTLEDDDEKQILAENVLGETEGRETEVVPDAVVSRVLEAVIPYASISVLDKFTRSCLEGDNLGLICTSGPFGSHVIEKVLITLSSAAQTADQAGYEMVEALLTAITDTCATSLYDMITSKYGSFVGRRLLCVLCGADVAAPPPRKAGLSPGDAAAGNAPPPPKRAGGLATRVAAPKDDEYHHSHSHNPTYPALFAKIAAVATSDDWTGPDLSSLQTDPYAGPFLQALLRGAKALGDDALAGRLVVHLLGGNAAVGVDSLTPDALHRLMTDRAGSHLVEVAFEAAPDDLLQKLCTTAFKGRLPTLASHPSANFAVQAALAAVRRPQQLRRMFEDLRPQIAGLLRARRGGVVAVLLAAAGRVGALESDAAEALWHAAEAGLDADAGPTPLHRLLVLDTTTRLGVGGSGRLSPLGCAAVITVLRFPSAASKRWAEAMGALAPAELAALVRDPAGCRVVETYLEGPGGAPKKRRKTLQALSGSWAAAASTAAGCRFVEKAFDLAEVAEKATITGELAAAEERVAGTKYGVSVLAHCRVDEYRRAGGGASAGAAQEWARRAETAKEVRKEFEDLFGEGDGGEEEEEEEGAGLAAEGDEQAGGVESGEEGKRKERKEKKKKKRSADDDGEPKRKKKKGEK